MIAVVVIIAALLVICAGASAFLGFQRAGWYVPALAVLLAWSAVMVSLGRW